MASRRGDDLRLDLQLEFREAIFGSTKEISVSHLEICNNCDGRGMKGWLQQRCNTCGSNGRIAEVKKLTLTIPPGVDNGTRLRISREGDAGEDGGDRGDLYIYLFISEDSELKRNESDIFSEIEISQQQAKLGCELPVNTIDGWTKLIIPPQAQPDVFLTSLTIKNRGVPQLGQPSKRGNHVITIKLRFPEDLTPLEVTPRPYDAVLGGQFPQPRFSDVVLGGE